jgi:hypothetical protein
MATSILKALNGVRPLQGQIIAIRSIQEIHPEEKFGADSPLFSFLFCLSSFSFR